VETRKDWVVDGGVLLFGRLRKTDASQTGSSEQRNSLHLTSGIEFCRFDEAIRVCVSEQDT